MSYILEALKKAQAERQLGSAPTIHAVPIQPMADQRERGRSKALLIGLGAVGLALAGAAAWWNQRTPQAPVPGAVVLPAAGAVAAQLAAAPAPATLPPAELDTAGLDTAGIAGTAPVPVAGRSAVVAAPAASVPMSAQRAAPPVARAPAAPPAAVRTPVPAPVQTADAARPAPVQAAAAARPAPVQTAGAAPLADVRAPEESLPLASQLPESQRAGLPQLTFGGYMYSKNPADRLLLIDKVLRREGEEIAPGLVLERLLPRSAVLNHRGVRYRVPY